MELRHFQSLLALYYLWWEDQEERNTGQLSMLHGYAIIGNRSQHGMQMSLIQAIQLYIVVCIACSQSLQTAMREGTFGMITLGTR